MIKFKGVLQTLFSTQVQIFEHISQNSKEISIYKLCCDKIFKKICIFSCQNWI